MTYYSDYPTKPAGGGNPYHCCVHCERSDPEINGELEKHAPHCNYRIEKEKYLRVEKIFKLWTDTSHVKLHSGEMTAQEIRSVKAVVEAVRREVMKEFE